LGDSPRAAPWIVVDALYSATYEHSKLEKAPNAKEDSYLEMKNGMIKIIQL
jgi:hypothetical protein